MIRDPAALALARAITSAIRPDVSEDTIKTLVGLIQVAVKLDEAEAENEQIEARLERGLS